MLRKDHTSKHQRGIPESERTKMIRAIAAKTQPREKGRYIHK